MIKSIRSGGTETTQKMNKLRQWTSDKLARDNRSETDAEQEAVDAVMQTRQEAIDSMLSAAQLYVDNISKKKDYVRGAEKKDKGLPVEVFGHTMMRFGDDLPPKSAYGNRLVELGSTLLDLGRSQSQLCGTTADTVIENTQRSLTQLKDYNNTKKKLESRRDNYFTLCTKTQKKNTDDTRLDTELRNAKVKYEESITETRKKAREIEATDDQSLLDLERFIEALVEHHTSCIAALSHITGANTTSNGSSSALVKELEMRGGQASTWPRRERGSSSFSRDLRLEIEPPQPSPARPLVRATTTLPDKRRPISPQLRRPSDIRRVTDLGPQRGKRHTRRTVFMRADHNYDADSSAELSLRVGDIIRVISSQHCQSSSEDSSNSDTDGMTDAERNGWCMGESTLSKRKGLFPAGYCSIVATPDPVALDIPKLPKAAKPLRLVSGSSTPTGTILDRTARGVEELNPFDATFEQSQATHSSRSVSGDRVPMIGINGNTGSNSPRYRQAPAPPVPPLSRGTRPVKPRSLSQAT